MIRLRLRVWEGDSWETARIRGESADFDHILHPLGGGDRPPELPEMPVNFRGFTLTERPQLGTAGLEANGAIKLTVSTEFALTGTQVRLLKSSDLVTWEDAGVIQLANGTLQIPAASVRALIATPREYYRIKVE